MAAYLVAYDLMKEKGSFDYEPLWAALRKLNGHRTQFSLWLVDTSLTPRGLHDHLKTVVDGNDRLWVSKLTRDHYYSNAIAGTNDWLAKRVLPA